MTDEDRVVRPDLAWSGAGRQTGVESSTDGVAPDLRFFLGARFFCGVMSDSLRFLATGLHGLHWRRGLVGRATVTELFLDCDGSNDYYLTFVNISAQTQVICRIIIANTYKSS